MRAGAASDSGFSLVETLVALFVVALLATSGGALLISSIQAGDAVKRSADEVRDLDVMHALLRDDLSAITRRGSLSPRGIGTPQGPAGSDRYEIALSFVRNGWPRLEPEQELRSDLQRVEYVLEDGRFIRRAYAAPDPSAESPVFERVLASDVQALRLRWFLAGTWYDEWETGPADPASELPSMVELVLDFESGDSLTQRMLVGGVVS